MSSSTILAIRRAVIDATFDALDDATEFSWTLSQRVSLGMERYCTQWEWAFV